MRLSLAPASVFRTEAAAECLTPLSLTFRETSELLAYNATQAQDVERVRACGTALSEYFPSGT